MASQKTKMKQVLSNGKEVSTSTTGWESAEVSGLPILAAGWEAGKATHHPISLGVALAAVRAKVPGIYLGDFEAETAEGTTKMVPVFDPKALNRVMIDAFVEKYDLDVPDIRIATNRSEKVATLTAERDALQAEIAALKERLAANEADDDEEEETEEDED